LHAIFFHEEPVLRINSMGDKETRARYARELANFFRKRSETLPRNAHAAKQDVFLAADSPSPASAPKSFPRRPSISRTQAANASRFLEYLEMTETPFELARTLISRGLIWNDTCLNLCGGRRVAWGSRYNDSCATSFFCGLQRDLCGVSNRK